MRARIGLMAAALAVAGASALTPVTAASMTCAGFQNSLQDAVSAAGDKVAQPVFEKPTTTPSGASLIDVKSIAGLNVTLRCKDNGKMDTFDAATDLVPGEDVIRIHRLTALAAAAVCAVSPNQRAAACAKLAEKHLSAAIKDFVRAKVRGEVDPSGASVEQKISGGYTVQFHAMPGNVDFVVGAPFE